MTATVQISQDRQNAIRLMQSRGWLHERRHRKHFFKRPDTGGLWDSVSVSHGNLSLEWAISNCEDEELARRIHDVRQEWVREALPAIFTNKGAG